MQDDNVEVSELSREILRFLIKMPKFPDIINKLSFINRQDLLYVIGQSDVLFRSTLNFGGNSVKSMTIYRKTGLTMGSDRYKTENLSTQMPDSTTHESKNVLKSIQKPKSSKRYFGVIPSKYIKGLESSNGYDDRVGTMEEIKEQFIDSTPNFSTLMKYVNEFVDYLFVLSHEKLAAEDESIAYECIHMVHEVLKKDQSLERVQYKGLFGNLIKHFDTSDISLLNEVIQVFKTILK
jgi:hypothetical protein